MKKICFWLLIPGISLALQACAPSPQPRFITAGQDFTVHYTAAEEAILQPVFAGKKLAFVNYPPLPFTITSSTLQTLGIDAARERRIHAMLPDAQLNVADYAFTFISTLHMDPTLTANTVPVKGDVTPKGNLIPNPQLQGFFPQADFLLDLHATRWDVGADRQMKLVYTLSLLDLKHQKLIAAILVKIDTPGTFTNLDKLDWEQHINTMKQAMLSEATASVLRQLPASLSTPK